MKKFIAFLIPLVILTLLGVVGWWIYPLHDQLVTTDEVVNREWANLDAHLERRYSLIPNLVAVAERSADHEADVFTNIANSYAGFRNAGTMEERIEASYQCESGLRAVFGGAYPSLQANAQFTSLMRSLESTEDAIQGQRIAYNRVVGEHNTLVRSMRGSLAAFVFGFDQAEYYEPPSFARELTDVDFAQPLKSRPNHRQKAAPESKAAPAPTAPAPAAPAPAAPEPESKVAPEPVDPSALLTPGDLDIHVKGISKASSGYRAILELPSKRQVTVKRGDSIPELRVRVEELTPAVRFRRISE